MGYTALYRKFRPQTFAEVVGQEHITRTLKNQIISGRVGHAYLFNGGRGTGKTSTAKILARAINCLNPQDGEPCNECEICKEALNGSLTDIVEMDAASNNGVDNIRNIKEEINFLPTKAKYRVYIIDEVHMLSIGAFNALLKTLEEPPEHVKFILATTEPQKLPATILSRCQRFDFKRISNQNIIKRLEVVCKESNINADEASLNLIAELSEGAMRDALSILERCVQDGDSEISQEKIRDLVGIPKVTYVSNMADAIINYDVDKALKTIGSVVSEGKDIDNLLWEMIKYIKDVLVLKTTGKLEIYNEAELKEMQNLAKNVSKQRLIKIIYDLSELEANMKWSTQKLIMFEAGIISLCNTEVEPQVIYQEPKQAKNASKGATKNIRQEAHPAQMASRTSGAANANAQAVSHTGKQTPKQASASNQSTKQTAKQGTQNTNKMWSNIVSNLKSKGKMSLYVPLKDSVATELNDLTIGIQFPNNMEAFGKAVLEKPENLKMISDMVSIAEGKEMHIKYIESGNKAQKAQSNVDTLENFANGYDIPINIVE